MRVKKTSRIRKPGRAKNVKKSTKKSAAAMRAASAWPIALVVMTVAAAAMLMAARQSSHRADVVDAESRPSIVTTDEEAMKRPTPAAAPSAATAPAATESTPATESEIAAPVTITGCLERDQETFRLKDASGPSVPKARSWKSGFFKKSTPSIEVIDAGNRVQLGHHIGERVAVRGTLVDREMQVRSLQRVADSCSRTKA